MNFLKHIQQFHRPLITKVLPIRFGRLQPQIIYHGLRFMSQSTTRPQIDPKLNYYKMLKVDPKATDQDIKAAFYKLQQMYHPDLTNGKTVEKFQKISNAYSIIGDPAIRKDYDRQREYFLKDDSQKFSSQSSQTRPPAPKQILTVHCLQARKSTHCKSLITYIFRHHKMVLQNVCWLVSSLAFLL